MKEQHKAAVQMAAAIEKFNRDARAHDALDELRRTYHIEAIYCTDAVDDTEDIEDIEDVKAANFDNLSASDYTSNE